jgi:hypothetical protein
MRELDIRCSASLDVPEFGAVRCQLVIGHEGTHAVMYFSGEARLVRCWDHRERGVTTDHTVFDVQRPWMRGYPVPAWETPSSSPPILAG